MTDDARTQLQERSALAHQLQLRGRQLEEVADSSGDAINAMHAAVGNNFRLLLK